MIMKNLSYTNTKMHGLKILKGYFSGGLAGDDADHSLIKSIKA